MTTCANAANLADSPIVKAFIEKFPLAAAIAINERIHIANQAYAELTGYDTVERLRGKHVSEFIDPSDRQRFLNLNKNGHAGLVSGQSYRWKYLVKGQTRIVEGHPTIFKIGDDVILISTIVDITSAVREHDELEREKRKLLDENRQLWERISTGMNVCVGKSGKMQQVVATAQKFARTDANIVIMGETGTGKSIIAAIIHDLSMRRKGPLISVNCAAIPAQLMESEFFGCVKGAYTGAIKDRIGFFGAAHKGTLFLDEVGELDLAMQAKLLHAVESKRVMPVGSVSEREVDVRLICATNRNLRQMVGDGLFREDLFYRIFVGDIIVPPLRDRMEDVPDLVKFFLERFGADDKQKCIPPKIMRSIMSYSWPGNVRELQNVILRYMATGEFRLLLQGSWQQKVQLPASEKLEEPYSFARLDEYLFKAERIYILETIKLCGGRKDRAAGLLGVNLRTFHRRCAKLGI